MLLGRRYFEEVNSFIKQNPRWRTVGFALSTRPLLELLKELISFCRRNNYWFCFGIFLDNNIIRYFKNYDEKGGRFVPSTHLLLITHKTEDNKEVCHTPENNPI